MEKAGIGRRYLAFFLDLIILEVLGALVTAPVIRMFAGNLDMAQTLRSWIIEGNLDRESGLLLVAYFLVLFLFWMLYFICFTANGGQTPGKKILGIRVLQFNEQPVDYSTAMIRSLLGYPLTLATLGLGFAWARFNKDRQTLHDLLAQTVVVRLNS